MPSWHHDRRGWGSGLIACRRAAEADQRFIAFDDPARGILGDLVVDRFLRPGEYLGGAAVVDAELAVMDGPFAESKELVGGYTMVEAPDLAAACELAKRTIKMTGAGKIEVREIANVGQ